MTRFGLAGTALALTILALPADAQTEQKIGVIQMQAAIAGTKEGQKAAGELEAKMTPKRKDLESRQSELQGLQDKLAKGGGVMTDQVRAQLTRDIDTKKKDAQRYLEDAQAEVQADQEKLMNDLGQKMLAVVNKYSKDNGYSLVIDVSNPQTPVMFASDGIDITKAVVDLYDRNSLVKPASIPSAAVPKPAMPAPAQKKN